MVLRDKELWEMTNEELWELFPIALSEPRIYWEAWYEEEKTRIYSFLNIKGMRLSHIGSTAIGDIRAKPIIDILLEIAADISMEEVKQMLLDNGYICMSENDKGKSFNKGYTKNGFEERVFHIHLRFLGDNDELYFRDYMREHKEEAKEYEALKLSLWEKYEYDRDGYTREKTAFVKKYTKQGREKYKDRYEGEDNHKA